MSIRSSSIPTRQFSLAFNRQRLPDAATYYVDQGLTLLGKGAWRSALCTFHADQHPSLRIHLATGAFRCMACGIHGGDVLAFHQQRYGVGFIEAAQALGAWGRVL